MNIDLFGRESVLRGVRELVFSWDSARSRRYASPVHLGKLLPGVSGITPSEEYVFVQLDDGAVHLDVQVESEKSILDDEIEGP